MCTATFLLRGLCLPNQGKWRRATAESGRVVRIEVPRAERFPRLCCEAVSDELHMAPERPCNEIGKSWPCTVAVRQGTMHREISYSLRGPQPFGSL
jgi:hypothetical protein